MIAHILIQLLTNCQHIDNSPGEIKLHDLRFEPVKATITIPSRESIVIW